MSGSLTATFVFTDLVDSTATAARLGPAAADELRQAHFHLLRGAVSSSGGTEVKNLGDGLMVVYSSLSRALAGAVGMQQAIEHHNRSGGEHLAIRVGLSTGEAMEDDSDYFGDPVVEAARLCAAARGGQILATDLVRLMVGRHAAQTLVEVGPLELKGIPEPVAAVEVLWEPATAGASVPLPGRLVGAAANTLFGFFGRDRELAALEVARKQAHTSGQAQLVLISGEAGMGKTALVAQAARAAHAAGWIVLFGHADEDLGVAYHPWIEVLETLVRHGEPRLVTGLPAAQRAALGRAVPEADDGAARVADPDMERLLLWEAVTGLLAAASRQAPVLVVLDDLHWADAATLVLLRHVAAASDPLHAVVVCTYRGTDLRRGDPLSNLLADLHREANVTRVELAGLEDTEVVELIEAAAGHRLDDAGLGLAHALRRETDGNPFFTGEILRHLGETGGVALGQDGRWSVAGELDDLDLPQSVHDVVSRRVERLGEEAARVLRLAAVVGREFDVDLLGRVGDVAVDPLLDLLDAATNAAVLVEAAGDDRYRFTHALIQHTLYAELSPARRQRAHQRVAEALEAGGGTDDPSRLAELAHHWVAATRPAELNKAIGYVVRAGDAARDALAPDDAIARYSQALDLIDHQQPPDEHARARVLAELGTMQHRASRPEWCDTLVQAATVAERLGDSATLVRAALGFNEMAQGAVQVDEAAQQVIAAALDTGVADAATRARLLAGLIVAFGGRRREERQDIGRQAIDTARTCGDDATFIDVLCLLLGGLVTPEDQHIADVDRAVALADRIGDPVLRFQAREQVMWARLEQADIRAADVVFGELVAIAETVGLPHFRFRVAEFETGRALLAGRVTEAEAANERALEIGTAAGEREVLSFYGGLLYSIRLHQGRVGEVAELFIAAADDMPDIPALRSAIPAMLCEIGRIEEARERLLAEAAGGFDFPYDMFWLASMVNLADAAATTREPEVARSLTELLSPFSDRIVAPSAIVVNGAVARPLARVAAAAGAYDDAERWFATADDLHAQLRAPYWTARGQLDHADLCLARRSDGDLDRARDLATASWLTAAEYGCAGLSERAVVILTGT